jgi:putative transposon-encoded protein
MARKINVIKNKIKFEEEFEVLFDKTITKFGTGAKIDAPKEYIGRDVLVFIKKKI